MTRRTKAQWRALIEAHASSGLTAAAFCRDHGLNPKYFSLRRRELGDGPKKRTSNFVPVSTMKLPVSDRVIVRDPFGMSVDLPLSVEPKWLAELLRSLRV
jgi:hypothetical protein